MGSRPGNGVGGPLGDPEVRAMVTDETLRRVEADKPGIIQWAGDAAAAIEARAATGMPVLKPYTPSPQAGRVADGEMSYSEGLRKLAGPYGDSRRYRMAAGIIGSDPAYWSVVSDNVGADNVDALMGKYTGNAVPGVTDFVFDSMNYGEKLALSENVDKMFNSDETGQVMSDVTPVEGGGLQEGQLYAAAARKNAAKKGTPSDIHRADVLEDKRVKAAIDSCASDDVIRNTMIKVAKEVFDKAREAAGQKIGTADETPAHCYEKDGKQFCEGRATYYTAPKGALTATGEEYKENAKAGAMNEIFMPKLRTGSNGKLQCVKVTNLDNPSKSLDNVGINDCGVYEPIGGKNREEYKGVKYLSHRNVIDLTPGAFKYLGGTNEPLHVEVEYKGECTGTTQKL
jgi:hypothetical protein